jgi:hypothetical protein
MTEGRPPITGYAASRDNIERLTSGPKPKGEASSESGGGLSESTIRLASAVIGAVIGGSLEIGFLLGRAAAATIGAVTMGSAMEVLNFGVRLTTHPEEEEDKHKKKQLEDRLRSHAFGEGWANTFSFIFKI